MMKREDHFLIPPDIEKRFVLHAGTVPSFFLWVDVAGQRLYLIGDRHVAEEYVISTSKYGVGNVEGSFKTPPGLHRIAEKYGDGAPPGRIFRDRIDTGENWQEESQEENLILTRILRLEGLEEGINRGTGIDSFERYIYFHGTNKDAQIGTPLSHGCICMRNSDIIRLYDSVKEGTVVFISG
jgi:UDP-N-acetylmuramate--alanine ligase